MPRPPAHAAPTTALPTTSLRVLKEERTMVRTRFLLHGWAWPKTTRQATLAQPMERILTNEARAALKATRGAPHDPEAQETIEALRAYNASIRIALAAARDERRRANGKTDAKGSSTRQGT